MGRVAKKDFQMVTYFSKTFIWIIRKKYYDFSVKMSKEISFSAYFLWFFWIFRWPALFNEYNISLAGRYITFLPPIVLSANISPEDELLKRPTTTTKKVATQEDETPTLLRYEKW